MGHVDGASWRLLLLTGVADVTANVLLVALVYPPLHAASLHLLLAAEAAVHEQPEKRGPQARSHPPTSLSKDKSDPGRSPGTSFTDLRQERTRRSGRNSVSLPVKSHSAGRCFRCGRWFRQVSALKHQPCFHTDGREETREERREERREGSRVTEKGLN